MTFVRIVDQQQITQFSGPPPQSQLVLSQLNYSRCCYMSVFGSNIGTPLHLLSRTDLERHGYIHNSRIEPETQDLPAV